MLQALRPYRRPAFAGGLFGQHEQLVGLAQHDALPAALDQSLLLPAREDAADRVQRGAGHLSDVLAADRKIDLDAVLDLAPGLLGEPKQRVRDALFDLLRRHLDHAVWVSCNRLPTVCNVLLARAGNFAIRRGHAADGHASATLSSTAIAVAG